MRARMNNIKLKRKKKTKKKQKISGELVLLLGFDWISLFFFSSHSVQSTQPKMKWPIVFLCPSSPHFLFRLASYKKKGKNRRRKRE